MTVQFSQLISPVALASVMVAGWSVPAAVSQVSPTISPLTPQQAAALPQDQEVVAAGQIWAQALASRNPNTIAELYSPQAVLLATFSNKLNTPEKIQSYFVGLAKREGLKVNYNEQSVRVLDENSAINSGLYTFSYVENGKTVAVPARYTFVYEKLGDRWMIVEHHSSLRPEKE